jgi:hypothetical protein
VGAFSAVEFTFGTISDGLSNTIFFSESPVSVEGGSRRLNSEKLSTPCAAGGNPGTLLALRGTGGEYASNATLFIAAGARDGGGWGWGDGMNNWTTFHTIISPNGPSCNSSARRADGSSAFGSAGIETAGSAHTGGVNGALGYGSVRFISESIDVGSTSATWNNTGGFEAGDPLRFGIWGALGRPWGGASVSF